MSLRGRRILALLTGTGLSAPLRADLKIRWSGSIGHVDRTWVEYYKPNLM